MFTDSMIAPAKLNLFLAVTGRREDGFHDLVSVVSRLNLGDILHVEAGGSSGWELTCDDPTLACDQTNLVLRAAKAFSAATGRWTGGRFFLEKRIPMGAGLGGGSSDAVAALTLLNRMSSDALDQEGLAGIAAQLGSDCPLFLHDTPVVMRGRGERISPLPASALGRLRGRRVVVFKPGFGISTPWAFTRLAADAPASYEPTVTAESRLAAWIADTTAPAEELLFNSMERPAFGKFMALPALVAQLRSEFGLVPRMSGSGSACFAFLSESAPFEAVGAVIRKAWGPAAFVTEARIT